MLSYFQQLALWIKPPLLGAGAPTMLARTKSDKNKTS